MIRFSLTRTPFVVAQFIAPLTFAFCMSFNMSSNLLMEYYISKMVLLTKKLASFRICGII